MLVRVHTHCLAGDVFGDDAVRLPGGGGQLAADDCGGGARGAGVSAQWDARVLDRSEVRLRRHRVVLHREQRSRSEACEDGTSGRSGLCGRWGWVGRFLSDLGIHRIRLLTNTPTHVPALQGFGIEIVEQVPVPISGVRR